MVKQRWLETYARVLSRPDAEIWYAPHGLGSIRLDLASLHEVKELRQKMQLDRREQQAMEGFIGEWGDAYIPWMRDIQLEGPGRQLDLDRDTGRVAPRGRRGR